MSKSIVLITGGNSGLGLDAAHQLLATGKYHVIIGSRSASNAEAAIEEIAKDESLKFDRSDVEAVQIDVTSDESIAAAAKTIEQKHGHLDVLMLNAGVATAQAPAEDGSGPSLRELYQTQFNTNLFGAVVCVDTFLPLLRKSKGPLGKRIAFTSSGLASLKWAQPGERFPGKQPELYEAERYPLYRATKTAMSMIVLHYAAVLGKEGFVVSSADPGYCATPMTHYSGFKTAREGAEELVKAAVGRKEEVHARTVGDYGIMPW